MKKLSVIFLVAAVFFGVIVIVSMAKEVKEVKITDQEIQRLIVGKWTWQGEVPEKIMKIFFEFFSDGSLDIRREKEGDGNILFPPTAIKKILKETMGPDRFSYEIKEKKIKTYLSSGEEIWGDVLTITATTLKINIKIGDSDFLFVLQKLK